MCAKKKKKDKDLLEIKNFLFTHPETNFFQSDKIVTFLERIPGYISLVLINADEKKINGILYYTLVEEKGIKKFITAYEKRLSETTLHKKLGRKVSYRRLIRLECYKLYRHFLGDELYSPYVRTR